MANNIYNLSFSDSTIAGKDTIALHMNSVYPDDYSKTFPIKLYGYGCSNYAQSMQENVIRLMENFCSHASPPANPTEGMLWYKESDKQLYLYTYRSGTLDWYQVTVTTAITRDLSPNLNTIAAMPNDLKKVADMSQPIGTILVTSKEITDPADWDKYWLIIGETDVYTYKKIKNYLGS